MVLDQNKPWVILSDIHGNHPAFEAVINDIDQPRRAYDLVFLGDLYGYGPMPASVGIKMNSLQPNIWLAGNHDKYLADERINNGNINDGAKESLQIHKDLSTSGALPLFNVCDKPVKYLEGQCLFSHGFPLVDDLLSVEAYDKDYHPSGKNGYIKALWQSEFPSTRVWFTGHSHTQKVWWFQENTGSWLLFPEKSCELEQNNALEISVQENEDRTQIRIRLPIAVLDDDLLIINPGSVGFPRNNLVKKPITAKEANYAMVYWYPDSFVVELNTVIYDGLAVLQGWRDGFYPVEELLKIF